MRLLEYGPGFVKRHHFMFVMPLCAFGEESMHEMDGHRALANRGCNPFDAAGSCVTHRKYSRHTSLEQERGTAQRPLNVLVSNKIGSGNNEPLLVQDQRIFKPLRAGCGTCHHKHVANWHGYLH